ncbi:MAG: hypothetical protein RBT71_11890 [Flavobacteriales bacterium]|nr:hypothetical protein [Flavobacteriales bacterium]
MRVYEVTYNRLHMGKRSLYIVVFAFTGTLLGSILAWLVLLMMKSDANNVVWGGISAFFVLILLGWYWRGIKGYNAVLRGVAITFALVLLAALRSST